MTVEKAMALAFIGFSSIAAMAWFFSTRPRLFIRVFVPREDLFSAGRSFLRQDDFRYGMRLMAGWQFAAACIFGFVSLWLAF